MLESRQLRHLLTIHREGSYGRAAEVLSLSQPALSNSISRLEDQLKLQLFERGRHGAVLTSAGRLLLAHAEQVERILQRAEEEMRLGALNVAGPLVIGGTPLALQSIVPAAIARLTAETGRVAIEVTDAPDTDLADALLRFQIDVAVSTIAPDAPDDGVVDHALFRAGIWAVVRPDHPISTREAVSLDDIRLHQLALPTPIGSYGVQIGAIWLTAGQNIPASTIYASTFATLRELLLQGGVVTLIPTQIVQPDIARGLLRAIPLRETVGYRTFGLRRASGRRLSAVGERFCQIVQDLAADYSQD